MHIDYLELYVKSAKSRKLVYDNFKLDTVAKLELNSSKMEWDHSKTINTWYHNTDFQ